MALDDALTSMHPSKVFEFLQLPAEIRNVVYWNALVKRYKCRRFRQPPLTLVNKQIRSEALPIIYGNGKFYIVFGRFRHSFERFQKLWPMSPATSNFTNITKLKIQWRFELGFGCFKGLTVNIRMQNNEFDDRRLLNKNKELVGRPGLEWKDQASIKAVFDRLAMEELPPHYAVFQLHEILVQHIFDLKKDSVIRGLLYFAEKCPLAAQWVWMGLKIRWIE